MLALLLFASVGLITLSWYRGKDYLWGIDANFPVNLKTYTYQYFYLWNDKALPGGADPLKLPLLVPLGLGLQAWSLLGLPFSGALFQRLLLYALVVSAEFGMYRLFRTMFGDLPQTSAIVAGIFYATSFFALLVEWSPLAFIVFEYAFFPLVLATFIRRLARGRLSDAAVVAIVWTVTVTPSYITVPLVILDWGIVWSYVLITVLLEVNRPWWRTVGFCLAAFLFWTLLNLFWIAPLAGYGSAQLSYYGPTSHTLFLLNSAPLQDAFRMVGYFGLRTTFGNSPLYPWYATFDSLPFIAIGYLLPVLSFLGLNTYRRRKEALFLALLLLVALFLAKGPNPPLGAVNERLYSITLISSGFRSTYTRFMEVVSFAYAMCLGLVIGRLAPVRTHQVVGPAVAPPRPRHLQRNIRAVAVTAVVLLVVGVYAWPLWTGAAYDTAGPTPSRRVNFPSSYLNAAAWLDAQAGSFNVVQIPYSTTNNLVSYDWDNGSSGFVGAFPLQLLTNRAFVYGPGLPAQVVGGLVNGTLDDCSYLDLLNARYVVISMDANWAWIENETTYLSPTPDQAGTWLATLSNCRLAQTFGQVLVFENLGWVPSLVRVSNDTLGFLTDRPPVALDSWNRSLSPAQEKLSPDRYAAQVTTAVPTVVFLNLAFDPHWELWVDGVRMPNSAHFPAYSYMNAWYVNATGNLSMEFVYPESILDFGAILSFASLGALLVVVAWQNPALLYRVRLWLRHNLHRKR